MAPLYVKDLMTPAEDCAIVKAGDTIGHLKQELCNKRHRLAVVVNDDTGVIEGVITVTDLEFVDDDNPVDPHSNKPAYTISPNMLIAFARKELNAISQQQKKRIHQLVVVNENNIPLGVLWDYAAILGCPDKPEKKSTK